MRTKWPLMLAAGGAACLLLAAPGHANTITNGNFATGDFTGWTASSSGDPYYTSVTNQAPAPGAANAALIGAYYDDSTNLVYGSIQQTVRVAPGHPYRITFQYGELNTNPSYSYGPSSSFCCYLDPGYITSSNDPSADPWAQNNTLNVLWGGNSVFSTSNFFTSANTGPTNPDGGLSIGDYFYQTESVVVMPTGQFMPIEFDASDYQQGVILTNINVSMVPEPGVLGLLGTGVFGLGLLRRRRRA